MSDLGKRQIERFNLSVPAFVTLKDPHSSELKIPTELRTRNISAGGAFMKTNKPYDIGSEVDIDLHLAFFTGNADHERRSNIHVSGSVIRIEQDGMAIQFDDKYQISPLPKDSKKTG
jgi:hypothetical protein